MSAAQRGSMNVGPSIRALAAARKVSPEERAAIRGALWPVAEQIRTDMESVILALTGPDPEYALYEFMQVIEKETPGYVRKLERTLSAARLGAARAA